METIIITIATTGGRKQTPAVWVGDSLAVHRPASPDGPAKTGWVITHLATGRVLARTGSIKRASRFVRQWDALATEFRTIRELKAWRHRADLAAAVRQLKEVR